MTIPKSIGFVILLILSTLCVAQVPQTLSYQGLLTDASGNPVNNATHQVQFNFFTNSGGTGTAAFTRGPLSVTTYQGLFTVIMGNGQGTNNAALPALGSTQYYVQTVADGTALSPLVQLTAVPYAYTASALDPNATVAGSQLNSPITNAAVTIAAAQITGTIPGSQVGTGVSAANVTTGTLPASVIPATAGSPIGSVTAFAGPLAKIPAGWLLCDGSSYATTGTYAALYAAIGNLWGAADGSHFNLPDLRGVFLRGWNNGSSTVYADPDISLRVSSGAVGATAAGDNVGSYQTDNFKTHAHNFNPGGYAAGSLGAGTFRADSNNPAFLWSGTTNSSGGNETRPKNAYVMYIIKAQ